MPDPSPAPPPTAAWAPLPGRCVLVARGADAVRFVDNFTTAALAPLAPGRGTEGFFADARGRVLAIANVLRTDEGLWLDAAAGVAAPLLAHLDRHLIRERVAFEDVTAARGTLLLVGPAATAWLAARVAGPLPTGLLAHGTTRIDGIDAAVVALDWFGPGGLLVHAPAADAGRLAAWLRSEGLPEVDAAAVDAARIAAGSPEPCDIDDRTLPQELGRDARAISFTKGCYLGQETVARLDALGHVNRRLVTLATATPCRIGGAVTASGETVGRVTSACAAPGGGGLGLALVHVRGLGGPLEIDGAPARVATVPVAAPREDR
ncbi:MAG: YgfZ/GcvT domain-containing protein [Planctomycetaceae bacterium]